MQELLAKKNTESVYNGQLVKLARSLRYFLVFYYQQEHKTNNRLTNQQRQGYTVTGDALPHFYKWLGTGALWVEEQRTINWPNCTAHHDSAHQNDYCAFRAKKWRDTTCAPHFEILAGATGLILSSIIHSIDAIVII